MAAQQQHWLEVGNCLQQLPQKKNSLGKSEFVLDRKNWQTAFALVLEMLFEADFQHKWAVVKIFPLLGDKIIHRLNEMVLDETVDAEVRWFICQVIGNFPQHSVVITLVQLLQQTTDSELIEIAGKTLSKIGDNAVEALTGLVCKPEHSLLAVKSLSYIRTGATVAPLISIASHEDAELRAIAVDALGSFRDRRITPILIAALKDSASIVRKKATIALGFRRDLCQEINLVEELQPLLYDLNLEICRQAAISLGRMHSETATTALYEVLQADTTPASLKSDLIKALGWSQISSGIDRLEQALDNASESIVQEIITALGRITVEELKPQSVGVLMEFWQQQQPFSASIRQTFATALGELGDRSASSILEQLATDSDRKVKLHAVSAIKKLSSNSDQ